MTERIDHAAEARNRLAFAESPDFNRVGWETADAQQLANLAQAQTHATLALAEQQRIANILKIDEMAMRGNYMPPEWIKEVVGL